MYGNYCKSRWTMTKLSQRWLFLFGLLINAPCRSVSVSPSQESSPIASGDPQAAGHPGQSSALVSGLSSALLAGEPQATNPATGNGKDAAHPDGTGIL